jgi:hypothetical protein
MVPATAAAAPIPPGTYGVQIGDGTLDIGAGLLPPIPLSSGTSFTVPIGTTPTATPIGLTIPGVTLPAPLTGSASATVTGAGVTIDPTTGNATLDASFYVSVAVTAPLPATCTIGSSGSPVTIHLTTANGSAWDPTTGGFSMADKTFVMPSCSNLGIAALLGSTTTPGDNLISIVGTALRQPDPVVSPGTNSTNTSTPAPGGGGGSTQTPTSGPTGTPAAPVACVVPKLVGKNLKQAKRALRKAHCKVGKAKKKNSKTKKKGRILKQRYKAGTKLPAGTKVPITVSRGAKKTRTHRSG